MEKVTFLVILIISICLQMVYANENKKIKIDDKTVLDVSVSSEYIGDFSILSIKEEKENKISVNDTDAYSRSNELMTQQTKNGFILYSKNIKRLEYIYDVKNSSKTIIFYGETKGNVSKERINLKLNICNVNFKKVPYLQSKRFGAKGREDLKEIVTDIVFKYNENARFVPITSYIDLANPDEFRVIFSKNGFELEICGGKDNEKYKAVLFFANDSLERREVNIGKFPNNKKQMTLYPHTEY